MGSAMAQVVGNVATELRTAMDNPGRERVSFRVIATERRRDPVSGTWLDGDEYAVTVVCWGALARGVAASVKLGDPVQVSGRLATRRWEADGETKFVTELKAVQVGLDLNRGRAAFQRTSQTVESGQADQQGTADAVEELLAAVG